MTEVFLGLGSNLNRDHNVQVAVAHLQQDFPGAVFSSVYESPARGFDGPPFFNLVAAIQTELSVAELMLWIRQLEHQQGRVSLEKVRANRTLDIDLLCYGTKVGLVDGVRLPREEICHNAFVLVPLAELAPQGVHPETGQRYAAMAASSAIQSQPLTRVAPAAQWLRS